MWGPVIEMLLELVFWVQLLKMQLLQILGKFRKAVGDALTYPRVSHGLQDHRRCGIHLYIDALCVYW